eukprot:6211991-Pleurochrysis_carterae.AAC.5
MYLAPVTMINDVSLKVLFLLLVEMFKGGRSRPWQPPTRATPCLNEGGCCCSSEEGCARVEAAEVQQCPVD